MQNYIWEESGPECILFLTVECGGFYFTKWKKKSVMQYISKRKGLGPVIEIKLPMIIFCYIHHNCDGQGNLDQLKTKRIYQRWKVLLNPNDTSYK